MSPSLKFYSDLDVYLSGGSFYASNTSHNTSNKLSELKELNIVEVLLRARNQGFQLKGLIGWDSQLLGEDQIPDAP